MLVFKWAIIQAHNNNIYIYIIVCSGCFRNYINPEYTVTFDIKNVIHDRKVILEDTCHTCDCIIHYAVNGHMCKQVVVITEIVMHM